MYWRTFIRKLEEEIPEQLLSSDGGFSNKTINEQLLSSDGGFSNKTINEQLAKYHATFFERNQRHWVDFAAEARYNLFVLKYG
jgi:hypothetical protein